jgi:predicted  nucleic acid-binding Zn-ribbon protein
MIHATPDQQRQLLALQEIDSRVAQLRRHTAEPPQQRVIDTTAAQLSAVAKAVMSALDELEALRAQPSGNERTHATAVARAQARLDAARDRGEQLADELRMARSGLTEAAAATTAALEAALHARSVAAQPVAPELLAAYQQARRRLGEVAVAQVTGHACGGCRLEIPALELERARAAAATGMPQCPACDRYLVLVPSAPSAPRGDAIDAG